MQWRLIDSFLVMSLLGMYLVGRLSWLSRSEHEWTTQNLVCIAISTVVGVYIAIRGRNAWRIFSLSATAAFIAATLIAVEHILEPPPTSSLGIDRTIWHYRTDPSMNAFSVAFRTAISGAVGGAVGTLIRLSLLRFAVLTHKR